MVRNIFVGCVLGCTAMAASAWADASPDDAIKYRQQVYSALGANITGIVMNLRGEVSFPDAVAVHAQAIADIAPLALPAMTQNTAGAGSAQTKAKPELWSEWADFESLHQDMQASAMELAAAAASGDMQAVGQATQALGGTCKACHDEYRD